MGTRREPGAYWSSWGPLAGPIMAAESPPALGVLDDPDDPPMPIGIAYPVGRAAHPRGKVATFRLVLGKSPALPGLWACVGRRFVPVPEAATRVVLGGDDVASEARP